MELSDLLSNCKVFTAEQSSVDAIERKPAVYAFYDLLRFNSSALRDDIDAFKTKHARVIKLVQRTHDGTPFLPDHVRIQFRGDPTRFKGEGLQLALACGPDELSDISRFVMFLSFVNEPLYIGKTTDMRKRFVEHHDKDFLHFMKESRQRHPGEFLLFAFFCPLKYTRLIESILLQIIKPAFCDQKT
jgi:hypothetical protein